MGTGERIFTKFLHPILEKNKEASVKMFRNTVTTIKYYYIHECLRICYLTG